LKSIRRWKKKNETCVVRLYFQIANVIEDQLHLGTLVVSDQLWSSFLGCMGEEEGKENTESKRSAECVCLIIAYHNPRQGLYELLQSAPIIDLLENRIEPAGGDAVVPIIGPKVMLLVPPARRSE